jgi:hypothetical protein
MPLSKFVQSSADRQEALEALAVSKLPDIQRIALELYNDPERRRDVISFGFLRDGYERAIASGTPEEDAARTWDRIADMVDMKLDDLAAVPFDQRDDLQIIAMSIILAASKQQAEIESGLITEAAIIGKESGEDLKANTKGLSRETLESATFHIKDELAARKKQRKADGNSAK